jgi:hypothetical protein
LKSGAGGGEAMLSGVVVRGKGGLAQGALPRDSGGQRVFPRASADERRCASSSFAGGGASGGAARALTPRPDARSGTAAAHHHSPPSPPTLTRPACRRATASA